MATKKVLILVLMEDTHRENKTTINAEVNRLNPCSNGRYSQRTPTISMSILRLS